MISIQSYVRQGQHTLRALALEPVVRKGLRMGLFALAGFLLSAASFYDGALPIAMGLICGCSGWHAVYAAAGAAGGYLAFWGLQDGRTGLWVGAGLAAAVILDRWKARLHAPLLIPAVAALIVAASGLIFPGRAGDMRQFAVYLVRVGLAFGCSWLFSLVMQRRSALADWAACAVGVFALAQVVPIPYLGLGFLAAGALSVRAPFPAAALGGLALDLAQVTPVPMTAVTALSFLVRLFPGRTGWLSRASPALVYAAVMAVTGKADLLPLPGLLLGGLATALLPATGELKYRRGETGVVQVRLEVAAGVLDQTRQLLLEVPPIPVDEEALVHKAVQRACGGCAYRKTCKDSRRMGQLGGSLLRRPLLYAQELPITCRKSGRFLAELRRSQEQLYAIEADRRRQGEYRSALLQQYRFLSEFLQELSDQLTRRTETAVQVYEPSVQVYGNRPEADNGDRCIRFSGPGGRYYVVLCDGMGSGMGAAQESRMAVTLLKRLLSAGFPAQHALGSLNSLCALRERAGAVTVDLAEIWLDSGKTVLYKWGAAPSYLISKGGAQRIGSAGPPPGIAVAEQMETAHRITLRRDQILILVSDGFSQDEVLRCCTEAVGEDTTRIAQRLMGCVRSGQGDDATAVLVTLSATK